MVGNGIMTTISNLLATIASAISPNGGMDVNILDQSSPPVDLFFLQAIGSPTALAVDANIEDTSVELSDSTGFSNGDYIGIFSGESLEGRFYFGEQIGAPVSNVISLDTPLDFAFKANDPVIRATRDLNVDGSVTTQIFGVRGAGLGTTVSIDVTRIIFQMITDTAPTFEKFGDLTKLLSGVVLRRNNSEINNIFNAKTNGELSNLMYDFQTLDPTNPSGVNGVSARMTFAGQEKHGVVIRLIPGDSLELLIQDDLTDLLIFRLSAQGHIVDE